MRTILLTGSPHKKGHTAALTEEFKRHLQGELLEWDASALSIAPCTDCRHCKGTFQCALPRDEMEELFAALETCDHLVIASPIWMETLTPPLLSLLSRLQPYFYHKERRPRRIKKAAVLLTGGGSGGAEQAYRTARVLFTQLNVQEVYPLILSAHTDSLPAKEDLDALEAAQKLAQWMNS